MKWRKKVSRVRFIKIYQFGETLAKKKNHPCIKPPDFDPKWAKVKIKKKNIWNKKIWLLTFVKTNSFEPDSLVTI